MIADCCRSWNDVGLLGEFKMANETRVIYGKLAILLTPQFVCHLKLPPTTNIILNDRQQSAINHKN